LRVVARHTVPLARRSPPWILASADDSNNGWVVTVDSFQPGAGLFGIEAIAYCAN
jgi:hypothetical protein